ncbi:MAG: hypothetical protein HFI34_10120 [Lachnospiraceae bacterium]|nr:hypothetical protein [Lachnospiraceae bacterium]
MNELESYIFNQKNKLLEQRNSYNHSIDRLKNDNMQIDLNITELTKNLDTTFEVFSPNSIMSDYNVTEIDRLKKIYHKNEIEIRTLENNQKKVEEELNEISIAIESYENLKDNINLCEKKYKEKEFEENQREGNRLAVDISEKEIKRIENRVSQEITQIIDSLIYKGELCKNILDVDANRSKIELLEIKEGLYTLQNKALDFMFHVKHSILDNNFYLLQNIRNHIKKYNVDSELITVTGIGDDVIMPSYDIQNNLRILDEIINNSIIHGKAKNININISIVSTIDKNEILSIVNQMDNVNESKLNNNDSLIENKKENIINKQMDISKKVIDYDLKEPSSNLKHINITVSDDGCGFDTNIINDNANLGLNIVKKRLDLYLGEFIIKSSSEFGTIVSYSFNYKQ